MVEIDAETCNLIKKHATKDTVKGALAAINAANDKDSDPNVTCSICYQMLHVPNPDGDVEKAVMFPCGHIFGHLCLMQWIDERGHSGVLRPTCPTCRREIGFEKCHHLLAPVLAFTKYAPKKVSEEDMPDRCAKCDYILANRKYKDTITQANNYLAPLDATLKRLKEENPTYDPVKELQEIEEAEIKANELLDDAKVEVYTKFGQWLASKTYFNSWATPWDEEEVREIEDFPREALPTLEFENEEIPKCLGDDWLRSRRGLPPEDIMSIEDFRQYIQQNFGM